MVIKFILCCLALSAEALALLCWVPGFSPDQVLYVSAALHMIAVLAATDFAYRQFSDGPLRLRLWRVLKVFLACLLLPLVGVVGLVLAALVIAWLGDWRKSRLIAMLPPLAYELPRNDEDSPYRVGHVRGQLMEADTPLGFRVKALLAIQGMPSHYTSELLREALGDEADDVRLLASGVLEQKEKKITQRIHDMLERFQASDEARDVSRDEETHYAAARELAELYWELVYQHLVQGDTRTYALEQAEFYTLEALKWYVRDAGLRVLVGRVRLQCLDYDGAAAAFSAAIALGFPPVRAEPYLAELAFLKRDYASVRRLMRRIRAEGRMPQLRQAASYWS